jgi:hypothetical protein
MKFVSPNQSIAIAALKTAIDQEALDQDALERLLWLTNCHPALISHAQIFEHIGAHLSSPTFSRENLAWAGTWQEDVPQWLEICSWISKHRLPLSRLAGLEQFARHDLDRHPIMRHGVSRHGIVSAIWNRHEECLAYPPIDSTDAAKGFFRLQGHLLAAFMESRSRTSNLGFYLSYTGNAEMPRAPVRTAAVGVAIRAFSLAAYSKLMEKLPASLNTPEFSADLSQMKSSLDDAPSAEEDSADRYSSTICRYFDLFLVQLTGWFPPQGGRLRTGGGGGGGHKSHHGFINVGIEGIYVEPRQPKEEDPDIPALTSQTISYGANHKLEEVEKAGDSPTEVLKTFFPLIPNDAKGHELFKEHFQKSAIDSAAQNFNFAYQNLTPEEVRRTNDWACLEIQRYLEHQTPHFDNIRANAVAGLVIRTLLCLGQSVDSALAISCHAVNDIRLISEFVPKSITLLILQKSDCPLEMATVIGFCLPAISPTYKSDISPDLEDANTATCEAFVLPDCHGLGKQLLGYLIKESTADFDSYHIESKFAKKAINDLTDTLGISRVTPTKLSRFLQTTIIEQTGDQTLAWVVTASHNHSNEPRMFYTRYRISHIVGAYEKASKRLSKIFGTPTKSLHFPLSLRHDEWAGSRFVVQFNVLKRCISNLQEHLEQRYQTRNANQQRNYHQRYLIYTILYQSLMTAYRAVNDPTQIYRAWQEAQAYPNLIVASLSDKDSVYFESSRLAVIPNHLSQHFKYFSLHSENLEDIFPAICISPLRDPDTGKIVPFFTLDADTFQLGHVDVSWLTLALERISGVPLPANFQRGFLRSELLQRDCPPEVIDAFLGHANQGEVPFSGLSTFDYHQYINTINHYLIEIHDDLGLRPMPSRLIPPGKRKNSP